MIAVTNAIFEVLKKFFSADALPRLLLESEVFSAYMQMMLPALFDSVLILCVGLVVVRIIVHLL